MPGTQSVPSPFAALLRRSKFATYDPAIGQVYTTHGGHAFRGDWGFKRPLPNRRRNGFITVRTVDSPEQQTEWNSAEGSARWMSRWEELGKKLEVADMGPWRSRIVTTSWKIESEFDRAGKIDELRAPPPEGGGVQSAGQLIPDTSRTIGSKPAKRIRSGGGDGDGEGMDSIPNPEAMTPKEFEKYINNLRELRPEFKRFVKEYWQERQEVRKANSTRPRLRSEQEQEHLSFTASGDVHMLLSAQTAPEKYINEFLRRRTKDELRSPSSTRLEQRPHTLAGLEYTWMSALQSKYLHKAVPGRHIGTNTPTPYSNGHMRTKFDLIAVGGIIGATSTGSHALVSTDFGTRESPRVDRERGKGVFRMSKVVLENPPQTVGRRPQKATDTKLGEVDFRLAKVSNLSNPHPLGSPEYVSQLNDVAPGKGHWDHHPVPAHVTTLTRRTRPGPLVDEPKHGATLIHVLENLIKGEPERKDEP